MLDWAAELDSEERSTFRRALVVSVAVHAALLLLFVLGPRFDPTPAAPAGVVTVELVAAPPGPAPQAAPAPPEPKPPAPKPEPVVAPPPPPPPPIEKKVVLPKEATQVPEKVPDKPKPAKTPPKDYDALMKELRGGETRPDPVQTARNTSQPTQAAPAGGGGTVRVSPEVMAWIRDARIHVRKAWIKTPGFDRLQTTLVVTLDGSGNVIGEPAVKERSGNPYYDDSVVRAIQKASPLPRPPTAGEWTFVFPSEETSG
jgi:colicin import membrane protein